MALQPLNSVGGFSVGEIAETIIDANGNITTTRASFSGNVLAANLISNALVTAANVNVSANLNVTNTANVGNLRTDNLLKADGTAWNFGQDPGGSNTQIQFNDDGNFAGSSALTFNKSTNVFTVFGNANVSNLGAAQVLATANVIAPQLISNVANGTAPLVVSSATKVDNLNADRVDGYDTSVSTSANTIVVRDLNGNVSANYFIGDGSQLTGVAFAGNLANGTSSVAIPTANGNVNTTVGGVLSFVVTNTGANVTGTLGVSGNANVGNLGATDVVATTLQGSLTTAAQPNVTSVGTLTGLSVNGNITAGNITANTGVFTGNGSGLSAIAGANVTGTVANATHSSTANTVTTAAQPNITSVGTLTDLTVSGNASAGNLSTTGNLSVTVNANVGNLNTGGTVNASGNITSNANVVTDLIVGRTTSISIAAAGTDQNVYLKPTGAGVVDVWGAKISNVATPVASTDVATKGYVDAAVEGLHIHAPCAAATPDTLTTISGGTVTYDNGTAGVGATLTTTGSYTTIDGVNIATIGTRILVKNETTAAHNGIYVYTSSTVLTRASDFDTPTEMAGGDFTFVQNGTLYNDTGWVMTDPVIAVGTTAVNWLQFSGAGQYTAGTGLTLNGTEFSISNTTVAAGAYGNGDYVATFTVNAQGQLTAASNTAITANAANLSGTTLNANIVNSNLTSVGTLTGLGVNGNIVAANITANTGVFTGNGSGLSALAGGNVTGQVANALVAGTVYTNAQPNITSVGTLTSLDVTGNIAGGNVTTTGQLVSSVSTGTAPMVVSSTTKVANLNADTVDGYDTSVSTSANTIVVRDLNGNVAANYFIGDGSQLTGVAFAGNLANGTSNVTIPAANGNVNTSVGGQANVVVVTSTGSNVNGYLTTSGNLTAANANLGNLATANFVNVASNLTVNLELSGNTANFSGNVVVANLVANGLANVGNLQVNGNVVTNLTPNANLLLNLGSSSQYWNNLYVGNITTTSNITANNFVAANNVAIGNSSIEAKTVITTGVGITTISEVPVSGVTGVDFIVKGADSLGAKYSMAHITAVTNGTVVEYSSYGLVNIGSTTGTLSVNIVGSNIALQVTPSSSNSTIWTTQFRLV